MEREERRERKRKESRGDGDNGVTSLVYGVYVRILQPRAFLRLKQNGGLWKGYFK